MQRLDAICQQHLAQDLSSKVCGRKNALWRIYSDKLFFASLFGANVRLLPEQIITDQTEQRKALLNYKDCREGGGTYLSAAVHTASQKGVELGLCVPAFCPYDVVRYWTRRAAADFAPDLQFGGRLDSITLTELGRRAEIDMRWAIVGLSRSGSASLAAWLDKHPQLQLHRHPERGFKECAFEDCLTRYLFHHLVPRTAIGKPRKTPRPGEKRILPGFRETQLLDSRRGRQVLAELKQVRFLVIVKDWLDWLKSVVLFNSQVVLEGDAKCAERIAKAANKSSAGLDDVCRVPWEAALVVQKVRALQIELGYADLFPARWIKVMHLEALRQEHGGLNRIANWIGGRTLLRNGSVAEIEFEFPRKGLFSSFKAEQAFWLQLCELPPNLIRNLDAARRKATYGLKRLLLQSGEAIPLSLLVPRPIHAESCLRARHLAAAVT